MRRLFAFVALTWIVACLALAGWALVEGQFGLTFGLVIAALAAPILDGVCHD